MRQTIEYTGIALICISVGFLVLLQFLPIRYTVTRGTEVSINTWRTVVWQLPKHMLSKFGNTLRISSFVTFPIGLIAYLATTLGK